MPLSPWGALASASSGARSGAAQSLAKPCLAAIYGSISLKCRPVSLACAVPFSVRFSPKPAWWTVDQISVLFQSWETMSACVRMCLASDLFVALEASHHPGVLARS